jgi:uncharacterized protein YndB with AHSA1/START domain
MNATYPLDPKLDLSFERIVDVPKELIWRAWTQPQHLMPWFCPVPWKTIDCEIDLRPGGIFRTVMQSPEGQQLPNLGCYLDVITNEKLVWTNALMPGFRPATTPGTKGEEIVGFAFTAMITLAEHAGGTKYTATVIHGDEASCQKHAAMGFREGWGKALEQLVAYSKSM